MKQTKSRNYDFSDYAEEVTGEELFKINGGEQVENSNKGVAGAKPGDTVTRNDGTTVTIGEADIKYAQQQLGINGNTPTGSNNAQNPGSGAPSGYNPGSSSGPTNSSEGKEQSAAIMYDPHDPSRIIVDLDNKKALQQAAELLADPTLGIRVTAYGSESGITKNFYKYSEINDYINPAVDVNLKYSNELAKDDKGYARAFFFDGQIVNEPKNGNVNLNTNFGLVRADIPLFDNEHFSIDLNLQSMAVSALVGMQGNRVGVDADIAIVKGGLNLSAKLNEKKLNLNLEGIIGGGASFLVGVNDKNLGLKLGLIPGYGGSLNIYVSEE